MIAALLLFAILNSVTTPGANPMPLLTPTHTYTMREAVRNLNGQFAYVNNPVEIGERFGRLVVINRSGTSECGSIIFRCKCDCGNETDSWSTTLRNGTAQSCGCLNEEHRLAACTKHGHTKKHGSDSRTYSSWSNMLRRCENPKGSEYAYYGGRGIKVCERWHDFRNFLADMGERPEGKTLDRYPDQNGNYGPGNCRWATREEQSNNVRSNVLLTLDSETLSIARWCRKTGLSRTCILGRLGRGWSVEKTLTTPKQRSRYA